jgi:hypothetical protein
MVTCGVVAALAVIMTRPANLNQLAPDKAMEFREPVGVFINAKRKDLPLGEGSQYAFLTRRELHPGIALLGLRHVRGENSFNSMRHWSSRVRPTQLAKNPVHINWRLRYHIS